MKFLSTIFFSLFVITSSIAQNAVDTPTTNDYLTNRPITKPKNTIDVAGSQYSNDEFQQGNVYKNGNLVASNVVLRYNVSRDEIEVKSSLTADDSSARLLRANPDIYIRILNDTYVYVKPTTAEAPSGYFKVLHEGEKFHLYKKEKKEFIEGMKSMNSISRDVPPTYKDDEVLYLVNTKDGSLEELSGSRNRKIEVFPSHNKELKRYTKKNNLNINKDYNLVKLVAYFNTLK